MFADLNRYVVSSNIHGECDICRMDGSISEVEGDRHLCRGCIESADARADSLVMDADSDFDDMIEAFKHVVEQHIGGEVVLHFPTVEDSPTDSHTYTVRQALSAETEWGDENTVTVTTADGTETYTGTGLSIAGMSL